MIVNVHERKLPAAPGQVGALLDRLYGADDCLWPAERWPISHRGALCVGAACQHANVRYTVAEYEPGQQVWFTFTEIDLHGGHGFDVVEGDGSACLRHTLRACPRGSMRILWPLVVRPIHDALVEDLLDNAERELTGAVASPNRYSRWVKGLRAVTARSRPGVGRTRALPSVPAAPFDPSGGENA
jgi:hypothetical protein